MSTGCSLLLTTFLAAASAARAQAPSAGSNDPTTISDKGDGMARAHMAGTPAPVLTSTRTAAAPPVPKAASATAAPAAAASAVRTRHAEATDSSFSAGQIVAGHGLPPDDSKGHGLLRDASGRWIEVVPAGHAPAATPSTAAADIPASPAQSAPASVPAGQASRAPARLGYYSLGAAGLAVFLAILRRL